MVPVYFSLDTSSFVGVKMADSKQLRLSKLESLMRATKKTMLGLEYDMAKCRGRVGATKNTGKKQKQKQKEQQKQKKKEDEGTSLTAKEYKKQLAEKAEKARKISEELSDCNAKYSKYLEESRALKKKIMFETEFARLKASLGPKGIEQARKITQKHADHSQYPQKGQVLRR